MRESDAGDIRIEAANAEKVLFEDHKAWSHIPEMRRFRDQWSLSRTSPHLRPMGRDAIMDFLLAAGQEQETALSAYFGRRVTIDRLDGRCVLNVDFDADNPPDLEGASSYTGFGTFRRGGRIHITFWR